MANPEGANTGNGLPGGGFLLNVNLVFISTIASYGLGFLTAVLMARALSDEDFGITALYRSAVTLAFAFFSLGVATAVVYYVARRDMTPRQAMESGLAVTLAATAFTAAGVLIARLLFQGDQALQGIPYEYVLVAVPATVQFRVVEGVLRAEGRFGAMNLLEISLPVSIILFLAAVQFTEGLTVESTVIAWTLAMVPPLVFGYVLLGRRHWPRGLGQAGLLWQSIRFGMQGQLGNLIQLLNMRLDAYIVLLLVNSAGVGIYAVGVALSEGMWLIANSIGVVLLTALTASDDEGAARMTPIVCRNTLLVTGLASIAAAVVAPWVVPAIFGAEYEASVPVFIWLLPGAVAAAGTKILAAYVFSRGRPLINAQIGFVVLVFTIGGDFALIPPFGVPGAAVATSIAYGAGLLLTAVAYRRLSGGSILSVLVPAPSDVSLYLDGLRNLRGRLAGAGRGGDVAS